MVQCPNGMHAKSNEIVTWLLPFLFLSPASSGRDSVLCGRCKRPEYSQRPCKSTRSPRKSSTEGRPGGDYPTDAGTPRHSSLICAFLNRYNSSVGWVLNPRVESGSSSSQALNRHSNQAALARPNSCGVPGITPASTIAGGPGSDGFVFPAKSTPIRSISPRAEMRQFSEKSEKGS